MFRIGIIGCGKIAQVRHLPEYAANPHAQVVGLCDMNRQRAEKLAQEYHAVCYAADRELLADPNIDAVSICSANASHGALALSALEAGKHVLCEKPMATTLAECEAMTALARKKGLRLMIGQNQRLTPAHQKARALIEAGAIGRPLTFRTTFAHGGPETWSVDPGAGTWFFDKKHAVMGAMADLGIHKIDLIQYLLDQPIVETTARLSTVDKRYSDGSFITVDDHAVCILRTAGGAVGTMTASWAFYGPEDNSTIISGEKGVIIIYADPVHSLILRGRDGSITYFDGDAIQTNDCQTASGVIDLFIESLRNPGLEAISAESVLSAMRVVFASLDSSEQGKTIAIPQ